MAGGAFSGLRRIYLALYNWVVFVGWQVQYPFSDLYFLPFSSFFCRKKIDFGDWDLRVQVFYLSVKTLKESGHEHVYRAVEKPLLLAQSAAVLEVISRLSCFVNTTIEC